MANSVLASRQVAEDLAYSVKTYRNGINMAESGPDYR
jgi:hypothetical protein